MIIFKKNIFFSFFASSMVFLAGCSKKENLITGDLSTQLTASNWAIHYFNAGSDITGDFSGYIFHFSSNGNCTAKKGNSTITGSWQVVKADNNVEKLQMNISSNPVLQSLNEWWELQAISYNLVEFTVDDTTKNKQFHFIRL